MQNNTPQEQAKCTYPECDCPSSKQYGRDTTGQLGVVMWSTECQRDNGEQQPTNEEQALQQEAVSIFKKHAPDVPFDGDIFLAMKEFVARAHSFDKKQVAEHAVEETLKIADKVFKSGGRMTVREIKDSVLSTLNQTKP
jgi:hypothetical protein